LNGLECRKRSVELSPDPNVLDGKLVRGLTRPQQLGGAQYE
jgi:hypothetical protein